MVVHDQVELLRRHLGHLVLDVRDVLQEVVLVRARAVEGEHGQLQHVRDAAVDASLDPSPCVDGHLVGFIRVRPRLLQIPRKGQLGRIHKQFAAITPRQCLHDAS